MGSLGDFVHLHVHSQYSMLDGACRLTALVDRVKAMGMGAVALTDHGNLFGALQFQAACRAGGIKPIFGCELYLSPTSRTDRSAQSVRYHHFLVLCENLEGWRNLSRLSSLAFLEGFYYRPRVDLELLRQYHEGLIATTACLQGPICQAILSGAMDEARRQLETLLEIFGPDRFYLELMDHGREEQQRLNRGLLELARHYRLPLIATNDCHYLDEGSYAAHDILLCIQMGKRLDDAQRMRFEENEYYLKSPEQMRRLFGHIEGALANTVAIAERCQCEIPLHQKLLPRFRTPDGRPAPEFLRERVREGLARRYGSPPPDAALRRADYELGIIETMGFVDYFLVVWDFIDWARRQGIPVGPGRGSGAGSIVAYALGITSLDPLAHGLLFERFLNPERVSMPDFDVDFCFERRGEVIEYVADKYGRDCVAQIITFGTLKARNAIRDVGRVMGMDLAKVDRVAKLIPGGPHATIDDALNEVAELRELAETDPQVAELLARARGIEGAIRQPGTHAAGIVICDRPLLDIVPLYRPADGGTMAATQFTMTEVEQLGLLKMDILGLKTLTLIDRCLKTIAARTGRKLAPDDIPLEDEATWRLLQTGRGLGIFQLESAGMRELLVNFRPARFSDLVALISLYRPGPMAYIPDFIARKEGRQPIEYEHPDLEPILKETYGLFVYQEQVMQVAQALAGYTLGGADLLRRAMSKKKEAEMARERVKFVEGCVRRGIDPAVAGRIFDRMESFAAYGFNKSHAAAYAVVAVQTAWLKAHYPVDFYAALITNEIGGDDAKIAQYFAEAREQGIRILPPDINTSGMMFEPEADHIRFGLLAIKGLGRAAVEAILEERARGGAYASFHDFIVRSDKRHLNARTIECLVRCGAFDALGINRPSLLAALPSLLDLIGTARRRDDAQSSLFDLLGDDQRTALAPEPVIPRRPDWSDRERFAAEKELVGFYLSGHPLEHYEPDMEAFATASAADLAQRERGEDVTWVGLIRSISTRSDRNGRTIAFAECDDMTGSLSCSFFADAFERCRAWLKPGEVIWMRGRLDQWKEQIKIVVAEARPIDDVRAELIRAIEVTIPWHHVTEANLTRLQEVVARHRGRRRLWLRMAADEGEVRYEASNGHGIAPTTALVRELQSLPFVASMRFIARRRGDNGAAED